MHGQIFQGGKEWHQNGVLGGNILVIHGELGSKAIPVTQPRLGRQRAAIVKLSAEQASSWGTAWGEDDRLTTPGNQLVKIAAREQAKSRWVQYQEQNLKQSGAQGHPADCTKQPGGII